MPDERSKQPDVTQIDFYTSVADKLHNSVSHRVEGPYASGTSS